MERAPGARQAGREKTHDDRWFQNRDGPAEAGHYERFETAMVRLKPDTTNGFSRAAVTTSNT
jgi:hypothetical protein